MSYNPNYPKANKLLNSVYACEPNPTLALEIKKLILCALEAILVHTSENHSVENKQDMNIY